jgi:hypothetical protein
VKTRSILRARALSVVHMPRQRDARLSVEERRVRRFLVLGTATTATTVHIGSGGLVQQSAHLLLWFRKYRAIQKARDLRAQLLSRRFSLQELTSYNVVSLMRFTKRDILNISQRITWRETTALGQVRTARRRYVASKEEALCVLLSRLAMPSRLEDFEGIFFRSKGALNEIFYEALECFLTWAGPLLSDLQVPFIRSRGRLYAGKISLKSRNATQHCVGFIDGTLIEIARPAGLMQRATYSGHKRRNGLKWQCITAPDGLFLHVFGPFEGRRHDMHLYTESGLDGVLSDALLIEGAQHYLFGDSGYAIRPHLITPYEGSVLTHQEQCFNKRMSKVRVSVEWAFRDIKRYFSHVAFPRKMVLSRTPAGAWYLASCMLWNFKCCIDGSPTARFFDCDPPTLTQYLSILD